MRTSTFTVAALLFAASLYAQSPQATSDPQARGDRFVWFSLSETREQLLAILGKPTVVADFGKDLESWQYQIGDIDHHDFSHQIVLRKNGSVVSITRNYEPERAVDDLFPEQLTTLHIVPGSSFPMRVRRLPNDVVAIAIGVSSPREKTSQIVLMRIAELKHFYPSLFGHLQAAVRNSEYARKAQQNLHGRVIRYQ
ncbi:MAG TPA: hypothetical protein VER03_17885 [Bryobacteraceae bacterium]|nr:hypothetical protein [Bryobacteraceae bacterium]